MLWLHIIAAYLIRVLTIAVNIHLTNEGFGPHVLFSAFIICIKYCFPLIDMLLKWVFQVSLESSVTPRYLVSVEKSTCIPSITSLFGYLGFDSLVNRITIVFFGLKVSPASCPQAVSSLHALCMRSLAICIFGLCSSRLQSSANPVP